MEKRIGIAILILVVLCDVSTAVERATYIVHMTVESTDEEIDNVQFFESSLKSVSQTANMLYAYKNVLNGFSVSLTAEEVEGLKALPDVISVLPELKYELHTTRTPTFLGINPQQKIFPNTHQLSDVIVGVLDTGIWPESKSFDDTGFGPIPSRWKGGCDTGRGFTKSMCNRKLIGARFFSRAYEANKGHKIDWSEEYRSPRDSHGHGTHTSTTAAGSAVSNASLFGYANGTARGMAPQARVAMYKCCWDGGHCQESDILAAMDKAIEDNVNVLSISMGSDNIPYHNDTTAIGAFDAMEKGIFVSCSAGNAGPMMSSVSNVAPWITTVGAGTLDRDFPVQVKLGNGDTHDTISIYDGHHSLGDKLIPFVYAGNVTNDTTYGHLCFPGTLIPELVKHKIVFCDGSEFYGVVMGFAVKYAGGAGMVLANPADFADELVVDAHLLPTAVISQKTGDKIKKYLFSCNKPRATIVFQGTRLGVQPAPVVAAFSSRGPSTIAPVILKPDLIAPGVNILAAWSGDDGPTELPFDTRRVSFNILSGTSMSCPHVSGLAALLKAANPNWSPAMIRSALMTTAYSTYEDGKPMLDGSTGNPSTPFDHGSGQVNPMSALDPGLVYDLNKTDYLRFLCALGYTAKQIKKVARKTNFTCNKAIDTYSVNDLNYPSFVVIVRPYPWGNNTLVTYTRTVTNVGPPGTYKARIVSPNRSGMIFVDPWSLTFSRANEKKSYTLSVMVSPKMEVNTSQFGRIEWYDGKDHVVRSPIVITWMP